MKPDITLTIGAENLADDTFKQILNMLQALSRQINTLQGEETSLEQTTNNLRQAGARLQLDSSTNMPQLLSKIGQITEALGKFDVKMEDVSGGIHQATGQGGADFDRIIKNIFPDPKKIETYLKNFVLDIAGTTLQFGTGATAPSSHAFNLGGRSAGLSVGSGVEQSLVRKFQGVRQDCIVRAMAIGLNLAYEDLYSHLEKTQKMNPKSSKLYRQINSSRNPDLGVANFDYEPVLEAAGFKPLKVSDSAKMNRRGYSGPRFNDLVNELVQTEVGRNLSLLVSSPKHMGAIKAGTLQDAWDSSKEPISEIFVREQDLKLPEVRQALENISRKVGKTLENLIEAGSFIDERSLAQYEEFRGVQQRKAREAQSYLKTAKPAKQLPSTETPKIVRQNTQMVRQIGSVSQNVQSGAKSIQQAARSVENVAQEVRKAVDGLKGAADSLEQKEADAWKRAQRGESFADITTLPIKDVQRVVERGIFSVFEKQSRKWVESQKDRDAADVFKDLGFGNINITPRYREELFTRGLYRNITALEKESEVFDETQAKMAEKRTDFQRSVEQEEIIRADPDIPTLVRSGPGTGKTFVMVERAKELIDQMIQSGVEDPFSKMIVTTHTKQAANELRERLETVFGKQNTDFMRLGTLHSIGLQMMQKNLSPHTNYRPYIDHPRASGWQKMHDAVIEAAGGLCQGPG